MKRSGWVVAFLGASLYLASERAGGAQQSGRSLNRQFQSAVGHYNSGQYPEAAQELESLARRLPGNFEVEELLGLVDSAEGKEKEASVHFEKAVRLKPDSPAARTNLAVNLSQIRQDGRAEAEFKRALQLEPGNYDANHDFGEFYVRAGKIAAAIPYLEKAEQANTASYENGYDLALAYLETKQWAAAGRTIRALLPAHNTAELHNLLGEADEKSGDFIAAVNEYQTAAQMNPSEENIFAWGGEFLLHYTWDPAAEIFSQGLKRYPDSARLAVGLGLALYHKGNFDEAVKVLVKATDLDPSDPRAYYFLSQSYQRSPTQAKEVIERLHRFAELQPHNARALYYYAMSLWKGKEGSDSAAWSGQVEGLLKKAVTLEPGFAEAHLQLANLYSTRLEYAKAVPEYQRALKLRPNLPDAHYRLGQAYVHVGRRDLAQKEFQLHQQLYARHLAKMDQDREQIRLFVYSVKGGGGSRP